MKIQKLVGAVAAAAIAFGVGAATAAPASAADNIKPFGQQERLNDWGTGAPMIGYTVRDLSPSSDPVPHNGQLYEATVTVDAFGSGATPMVPMFNARAEHGANYPLIADAGVGGALAAGRLIDWQALFRCRGRHTQQRRLQRRHSGHSRLDTRSPRRGYAPLAKVDERADRVARELPPRQAATLRNS